MRETIIQIRYGDKYGDNQGCTTVRLPAWLEEAPLPKIKGLLKLAAQKAADDANAGEILRLEAYITNAIEEAKTDLAATEKIEDRGERGAEKRRIENWIKRLQQIRGHLAAALDKYMPKR